MTWKCALTNTVSDDMNGSTAWKWSLVYIAVTAWWWC